jgi:hypothetical protein
MLIGLGTQGEPGYGRNSFNAAPPPPTIDVTVNRVGPIGSHRRFV